MAVRVTGAPRIAVVGETESVVLAADAALLVKLHVVWGPVPLTVAVTLYVPGDEFARAVTLAIPFISVTAELLDSAALGPMDGTAKLTVTKLSGFPLASVTLTCRGEENAVDTLAVCDGGVAVKTAGGA